MVNEICVGQVKLHSQATNHWTSVNYMLPILAPAEAAQTSKLKVAAFDLFGETFAPKTTHPLSPRPTTSSATSSKEPTCLPANTC